MSHPNQDGSTSWTESMTARERIRAVAETLAEPRSTNWISSQADAAWDTTKDELEVMVARGRLQQVGADDATLYQPDHTQLLFDEIRTLIEEETRQALRDELVAISDEIEGWQAEYDVASWEELEQTLGDDDRSSEAVRERRDVIQYWQENEQDRRLIQHALSLYSDVENAQELTADG